jgi:hypothetical protein
MSATRYAAELLRWCAAKLDPDDPPPTPAAPSVRVALHVDRSADPYRIVRLIREQLQKQNAA